MNQNRLKSMFNLRQWLVAASVVLLPAAAFALDSVTFSDVIKSGSGVGDINLRTPKSQAAIPDLNQFISSFSRGEFAAAVSAIAFGADINEAANGTEKAETQAVTVEFAWLEVADASGTRNFGKAPSGTAVVSGSSFFTETQAIVARKGSTQRATYYTLLGRSGSANITGANTVTGAFDSTLKIAVPAGTSFSNVTKSILHVRLLDTNGTLGDPEAFYDLSGGYEDVALLTEADATFLDSNSQILASRTLAPSVELSAQGKVSALYFNTDADLNTNVPASGFNSLFWVQRPGANRYNLVAYEDLYPNQGDYDFNDLIVAYNYALGLNGQGKVEELSGVAYIVARGSSYTHDWTLSLPVTLGSTNLVDTAASYCKVYRSADQKVPGEVASSGCSVSTNQFGVNWKAFADTVKMFPGSDAGRSQDAMVINTATNQTDPLRKGPKAEMKIRLKTPVSLRSIGKDDPFIRIYRTDNSQDVVRLTTRDANKFPFAMMMPTQWKWPQERVGIGAAYPDFFKFVQSSGAQGTTWYNSPDRTKVAPVPNTPNQPDWTVTNWAW
ncbi:MAG: hypothetical protein RL323_1713 [Pseudomonadota bacterium]|jgi:LruC domain-containing protein